MLRRLAVIQRSLQHMVATHLEVWRLDSAIAEIEMHAVNSSRIAVLLLGLIVPGSTSCGSASDPEAEAEVIRATERDRLRALVQADVQRARELHADDFQLINPRGEALSKEQYLGGIETGQIDYLVWEPDSLIDVRVHREAAVIRYQSKLEIVVQGQKVPLQHYWHTDSYEKRNGRWQVVWSQATQIP